MTTTAIQSIQRGIVLLVAEWSPSAQWARGQLVTFLEQRQFPLDRLHFLDVDNRPDLYEIPEFVGRIHGRGEAAVVRNGRIVFVTVLGKSGPVPGALS